VGSTKPVLKHYGALPGLNLEENFDLGQHSPPLNWLNFDLAFRLNGVPVSRRVLGEIFLL